MKKENLMIARREDYQTAPLFSELFPFGGQVDESNRWIKLSRIIPWDEFEREYEKSLKEGYGRPAHSSRLVIGLLILKHTLGMGDKEIVRQLSENIYFQYFCGFEHFQTKEQLDPSVLTYARRRISRLKFEQFENHLIRRLTELKLIRPKKVYVDATVFPVDMAYPNDVNLLEKGRRFLVKIIREVGEKIQKTYRTYSRKAKETFLSFSKKKLKTQKVIRWTLKKTLQFVRRNIGQVKDILKITKKKQIFLSEKTLETIRTIEEIFKQQFEMYKKKAQQIKDRIVSLSRPHIRPIKRGKHGKLTEFGPKASLSYTDGYAFLDHYSLNAYHEATVLDQHLNLFEKRFSQLPQSFGADRIYGTRENRDKLINKKIRFSFSPLGRKNLTESPSKRRWRRQDQKYRGTLMEGIIGHAKQHFGLNCIKAKTKETEKVWVQLGLLSMNLKTALNKVSA